MNRKIVSPSKIAIGKKSLNAKTLNIWQKNKQKTAESRQTSRHTMAENRRLKRDEKVAEKRNLLDVSNNTLNNSKKFDEEAEKQELKLRLEVYRKQQEQKKLQSRLAFSKQPPFRVGGISSKIPLKNVEKKFENTPQKTTLQQSATNSSSKSRLHAVTTVSSAATKTSHSLALKSKRLPQINTSLSKESKVFNKSSTEPSVQQATVEVKPIDKQESHTENLSNTSENKILCEDWNTQKADNELKVLLSSPSPNISQDFDVMNKVDSSFLKEDKPSINNKSFCVHKESNDNAQTSPLETFVLIENPLVAVGSIDDQSNIAEEKQKTMEESSNAACIDETIDRILAVQKTSSTSLDIRTTMENATIVEHSSVVKKTPRKGRRKSGIVVSEKEAKPDSEESIPQYAETSSIRRSSRRKSFQGSYKEDHLFKQSSTASDSLSLSNSVDTEDSFHKLLKPTASDESAFSNDTHFSADFSLDSLELGSDSFTALTPTDKSPRFYCTANLQHLVSLLIFCFYFCSRKRRRQTRTPGELDIDLIKVPEVCFDSPIGTPPNSILKSVQSSVETQNDVIVTGSPDSPTFSQAEYGQRKKRADITPFRNAKNCSEYVGNSDSFVAITPEIAKSEKNTPIRSRRSSTQLMNQDTNQLLSPFRRTRRSIYPAAENLIEF